MVNAKRWFPSVALAVLFRILTYDIVVDEQMFRALTEKEAMANEGDFFLPRYDTCIFILSTPGSGSSTMVRLLNEHTSCEISGENSGAFIALARFEDKLMATERRYRGSEHSEVAWHKVYDILEVKQAEINLARTMLNPQNHSCWGFKEILYGRDKNRATFTQDLEFLRSLCRHPKILIHTRDKTELELQAAVLKGKEGEHVQSRLQRDCFDLYTNESSTIPPDKYPGCSNPERAFAFRHYLEDYIEGRDNEARMWDYLGFETPSMNATKITVLTGKEGQTQRSENATKKNVLTEKKSQIQRSENATKKNVLTKRKGRTRRMVRRYMRRHRGNESRVGVNAAIN